MKNSLKFLFAVVSSSIILFSCKKDYLETKPSNAVADEILYSTTADMQSAMNGAYTSMFQFALGGYGGHDNYGQKSFDLQIPLDSAIRYDAMKLGGIK